ncbi:hypothetical protein ARTHRO_11831 [Limnospira indica PCC 8005]|uniref:Uncharacterized protein n=1 Tax=Limnospira indica PCC 8005 TaxID=376219 RepID=A0A9P1KE20_9CYAN|nr:hypothetical protein ARTHRO_11831 [Limnospira indica PCC 8005]
MFFKSILRFNTILWLITLKYLTRAWGFCYPQRNRIQGLAVSTRQKIDYNPHDIAKYNIIRQQFKIHDARVFEELGTAPIPLIDKIAVICI